MGCTIYDIAHATGLSIATISRVINNQGKVKPETSERVWQAIEELGYIPSAPARRLASKINHTLGLFMGNMLTNQFESTYQLRFMSGVVSVAGEFGYDVLIDSSKNYEQNFMKPRNVDGLIFPSLSGQTQYVEKLIGQNFPLTYAGIRQPFDKLGQNVYGGYHLYRKEIMDLLVQRGYRKIVLMEDGLDRRDPLVIQKLREVVDSMHHRLVQDGGYCRVAGYKFLSPEQLASQTQELFSQPDPPDALCLDSTECYITIYEELLKMGLRVPEDLAVVATSHSRSIGLMYSPPLTCVFQDAFEMGDRCARLLIRQIEKPDLPVDQSVPWEFIERGTLPLQKK